MPPCVPPPIHYERFFRTVRSDDGEELSEHELQLREVVALLLSFERLSTHQLFSIKPASCLRVNGNLQAASER